ncbi:MAG: hypothetical protein KF768_13330 [Phycisphaeraceae bacterium]|nr:hypothetical protein [Phycisphaeraceae bacterium]
MTLSLAAFFHNLSPFTVRFGGAFVLMRHPARRGRILITSARTSTSSSA